MCLAVLRWQRHPTLALDIIANRDEFVAREAKVAHRWPQYPHIVAGQDLAAGGTWLGASAERCGLLTNVRDPKAPIGAKTRGGIIIDYLNSSLAPNEFAQSLDCKDYSPFNLLLYGQGELVYLGSHPQRVIQSLSPGIYTLSNAQLNTPWPKANSVGAAMRRSLSAARVAMSDTRTYPDNLLPNTGIDLAWERRLSSAKILGDNYATRCTTEVNITATTTRLVETTFPGDQVVEFEL